MALRGMADEPIRVAERRQVTEMTRTRFALVGAGVIGTHHSKVMHQLDAELELVAVVDADVATARTLAAAPAPVFMALLRRLGQTLSSTPYRSAPQPEHTAMLR